MKNKLFYPFSVAAALCVAVMPQTAAAFDTTSAPFSTVGNWQLTREGTDIGPRHWCRAVATLGDGNEVSVLQGELLPAYGTTFVSVVMPQRALPRGYEGITTLQLDGTAAVTGTIVSAGDWQGDTLLRAYARAEFPHLEGMAGKLKQAESLVLTAHQTAFQAVELKDLDMPGVFKELEACNHLQE